MEVIKLDELLPKLSAKIRFNVTEFGNGKSTIYDSLSNGYMTRASIATEKIIRENPNQFIVLSIEAEDDAIIINLLYEYEIDEYYKEKEIEEQKREERN